MLHDAVMKLPLPVQSQVVLAQSFNKSYYMPDLLIHRHLAALEQSASSGRFWRRALTLRSRSRSEDVCAVIDARNGINPARQ